MEFLLAATSSSVAGLFTNPLEVAKTRLQLQGELKAKGTYSVHYRNVFHAFYTVARKEGLFALQKGLVPAVWYQFVMNGTRLGCYQTFVNFGFTKRSNSNETSKFKVVACGAISGAASAFTSNPFALMKTHLQSRAAAGIAVGHQHGYKTMSNAIQHILHNQGLLGLWRGLTGNISRISIGSATQLSTFTVSKEWIRHFHVLKENSWVESLVSGFISGIAVTLAMTPSEVVALRLFNQPVNKSGRGVMYNGFFDCIAKIAKQEGLLAFYKGGSATYFRVGPHSTLNMLFWDLSRRAYYGQFN